MPRKTKELDDLDKRLLRELVRDSKRSYRKLSRDVGMSPAALIERIRGLERRGLIEGYGCRLDFQGLGFEFMAIVEVNINSKDILAVEQRIARIPQVAAVWDTTGEFDAMAVLMCKSRSELSDVVKKILGMKEVEKTNTNMVLNVVKRLTEFAEV